MVCPTESIENAFKLQDESFEQWIAGDLSRVVHNLDRQPWAVPERVSGVRVSADFFNVLGVKPRLGRAFLPEEEQPGKHQVVVISDALWRNRYNADPDIIGKTVRVDSEDHTVIGVMPPNFEFQLYSPIRQLWVPVAYTKGDQDRGSHSFLCLARLKPGVTMEQARARMNNIGRGLAEQYPQDNAGKTGAIDPFIGFDMESQQKTLLTLLALEVALALVVLTGAGLMIQSMARLLNVAPGFDPHNVLALGMSLPQENTFYGPPGHPQFARNLQEYVGSIPGVISVSAVSHTPVGGGNAGRGFVIEGRPDPGSENQPGAKYTIICPNYFQTMGIKQVSGREFTERDSLNTPGVIVINEAMAKRYWLNEDPIGKRIKIGFFNSDAPWLTVVGITQDVKQGGLDQKPRPEFFRPYNQAAWPVMTVVVRRASSPGTFINPIKQALARFEPDRAVSGVRTMEEAIYDSVGSRRFPMILLVAFSLLALTLSAVGISGVVAFSVSQRTREIGIRMALGAQKGAVMRLALNRSMTAALIGVGIGLAASFALTRFLTGLLFEVKPMDPLVLGSTALILTGVAFIACYMPARRAAKVDPMTALRCE